MSLSEQEPSLLPPLETLRAEISASSPSVYRSWWDFLRQMLFGGRPRHVKIYLLLDRSGSMRNRSLTVVQGYNKFLQSQKDLCVEGETCDVSTYFFSDTLMTIHEDVPLSEIPSLTLLQYRPHGSTALRDAIASIYQKILESRDAVATRRIVVILTDGGENASTKTSVEDLERLKSKVASRTEILYLGSNQDAVAVGQEIGATRETSLNYNDENLLEAIESMGRAVSRGRSGGNGRFTNIERAQSMGIQSESHQTNSSTTTEVH